MLTGEQKIYHLKHFLTKGIINIWDYIDVPHSTTRVYYKASPDGLGFDFYVAEVTGYEGEDVFNLRSYAVCVCQGSAAFDGIRHIHFGDEQGDGQGYINYPNILNMIEIFKILRQLEEKYCREHGTV